VKGITSIFQFRHSSVNFARSLLGVEFCNTIPRKTALARVETEWTPASVNADGSDLDFIGRLCTLNRPMKAPFCDGRHIGKRFL
jgi:hypothetical protein